MTNEFPRIKDLPEHEQEPFSKWLEGQTVPVRPDGEPSFYQWDYETWKAGLPPSD
jgi:hypothetical protein